MEKNRKRPDCDFAESLAGKRSKTTAMSEELDNVEKEVMAWLCIEEEESTEDLSKLLEKTETAAQVPAKVKFIDDPYATARIFQSSSSYVTINGNEELCGSSFSDWDSSVMASVDMGGIKGLFGLGIQNGMFKEDELGAELGGAWGSEVEEEARGWVEESGEGCLVEEINGAGGGCDEYDNMLAKFLGEDLFVTQ